MLRIQNISKAFGDKVLFKDISYHFPEGEKVALVGANGQGKTTLLNIMTGKDYADSGDISKPKDAVVAYLPQSPNPNPASTLLVECLSGHETAFKLKQKMDQLLHNMEVDYQEIDLEQYTTALTQFENLGGYELEGRAEQILLGLGFKREQLDANPLTLSGGWRMRIELGKILLSSPDFMILDEPTNHLDLPSIEWLEEFLQNHKGTIVFVSHDQEFLNNVATITLYLNKGVLRAFTGNFDAFLKQKESQEQATLAAVKKIETQKAHMQSFVDRFKAKATKAKQAQSRVKMINKLDEVLSGVTVDEGVDKIHFPRIQIPNSPKDVLVCDEMVIGYEAPLSKKIKVKFNKTEKIAIVGRNGIGKSTFLKTICGEINPLGGSFKLGEGIQIGYFAQESAEMLDTSLTVLETIQKFAPALSEQEHRGILGCFLFKGQDPMKRVRVLSGGEKSRLVMASLIAQRPNLLIFDEPTNHLDMLSCEILAKMLEEYKGTCCIVSHNRHFIDMFANVIVDVSSDGKWETLRH
ncbi:ABC-F family ATP-binding cassette domain-containing protein [Candidatus Odyssella acanthamoebae]|uniref:ABC-F family ATP-binding cassette domain-containing protein n=1 Tax=Candidatus Odyssella acanthamoebae TaxID=91604 RepID=UPI00068E8154|nr:ABC-F family ATP-binding cassette domain-containing protein [Candidatus Paracaedibacter acanthamoebae]